MRQGELRKKIENYTYGLNDRIHLDASANIFKGINENTEERVTIKVIDMKQPKSKEHKAATNQEIQLYRKSRHPNIVQLCDIYSTTNNCYIVTEYMDDGDLRNLLRKRGKLREEEAVAIFRDVFNGWHQVVTAGFIHGNLRPENVFFKNKVVKIGNFGSCCKISTRQLRSHPEVLPFNPYHSPQVLSSKLFSTKSDIWALALIIYEMLHGKLPWDIFVPSMAQEEMVAKMHKSYPLDKDISDQVKDFMIKCLNENVQKRKDLKQLKRHPFILKLMNNPISDFRSKNNNSSECTNELNNILATRQTSQQKSQAVSNSQKMIISQNGKIQMLIPSNKKQSQPYNSTRTERQISCMINWMRFLFRLYQRMCLPGYEGQYQKQKCTSTQMRFIVLRQLYTQLYCLMENLYQGTNIFNFHNWALFFQEKQKLHKYVDIVSSYEQRYQRLWAHYLKCIDDLMLDSNFRFKTILNQCFPLSQYNSIVAVAISLGELRMLWAKVPTVPSQTKQIIASNNIERFKGVLLTIDLLITYYQLNCLLVDDFYKIDYFDRMSKLDVIIQYLPVELELEHLPDLKSKMHQLGVLGEKQ